MQEAVEQRLSLRVAAPVFGHVILKYLNDSPEVRFVSP
jgi:hypothetical protein